jgi:YggT family protein
MEVLVTVVSGVIRILTLVIVVNAVLSFVMDPYHPVRQTLDRIVEPMLSPIRRLLPQTGPVDLSPLVLLIVLQVVDRVLISLVGR